PARVVLGNKLRALREAARFETQAAAAKQLNITAMGIGRYESGVALPGSGWTKALLELYGADAAQREEVMRLRDEAAGPRGQQEPSPERVVLGNKLRALREAKFETQTDAAKQSNIKAVSIGRYESGSRVPDPARTEALLELYGVRDAAQREEVMRLRDEAAGPRGQQEPSPERLMELDEAAGLEAQATAAGVGVHVDEDGVVESLVAKLEGSVAALERHLAALPADYSPELRERVVLWSRVLRDRADQIRSGADMARLEKRASDAAMLVERVRRDREIVAELDSLVGLLDSVSDAYVMPVLREQINDLRAEVVRGDQVADVESRLSVVREFADDVRSRFEQGVPGTEDLMQVEEAGDTASAGAVLGDTELSRIEALQLREFAARARAALEEADQEEVKEWYRKAGRFLGELRASPDFLDLMAHHFMANPNDWEGAWNLRARFLEYMTRGVRAGAGPEPGGEGSRSSEETSEEVAHEQGRQEMLARLERLAGSAVDGVELGTIPEEPESGAETASRRQSWPGGG
uniref:helix-turn-helix transcriptional regulator n=1 Tax=Saccharopolyspora erythraea TaxID=1836 RepID=UPI001E46BFB8